MLLWTVAGWVNRHQQGVITTWSKRIASYAGEWVRQAFSKQGISYMASASPKSDLYGELLPLVNGGKLELLDMPRLKTQLVTVRVTWRSCPDRSNRAPPRRPPDNL